jgi:hypothetical protein
MGTKCIRSSGAALVVCFTLLGVVTALAYAEEGENCSAGSGRIKVSPALSESPQVVRLTFRGNVGPCTGKYVSARFTAVVQTTGAVQCSALTSGGEPTNGGAALSWQRKIEFTSIGSEFMIPFTGSGEVSFSSANIAHGQPFEGMHLSGKLAMHFGPCGGKAKVHKGTFTSSELVVS